MLILPLLLAPWVCSPSPVVLAAYEVLGPDPLPQSFYYSTTPKKFDFTLKIRPMAKLCILDHFLGQPPRFLEKVFRRHLSSRHLSSRPLHWDAKSYNDIFLILGEQQKWPKWQKSDFSVGQKMVKKKSQYGPKMAKNGSKMGLKIAGCSRITPYNPKINPKYPPKRDHSALH